jgi:hypothetical protein
MNTQSAETTQAGYADPTDVTGWVLVLCLVLLVAQPASSLYRVFFDSIPHLVRAKTFASAVLPSVFSTLLIGLAVFSFTAGLNLWSVKPGAVIFAKRFLLTYLGAHVAYFFFWMLVAHPHQRLSFAQMGWNHIVGPLLFFAFWYTYLEHSKRIRKMYPFG